MRVAICAFVMLEVLTTASSMNTEHRQLRMVNRLTEANPKSESNDDIGDSNPTNDIIKKVKTVPNPNVKITDTHVDKVAPKPTAPNVFLPKVITPVDKGAVKATASKETASKPTAPKPTKRIGVHEKSVVKVVAREAVPYGAQKPTAQKPTAPNKKIP